MLGLAHDQGQARCALHTGNPSMFVYFFWSNLVGVQTMTNLAMAIHPGWHLHSVQDVQLFRGILSNGEPVTMDLMFVDELIEGPTKQLKVRL